MSLKRLILIITVYLLLGLIFHCAGPALGYFADTETSADNILRFAASW